MTSQSRRDWLAGLLAAPRLSAQGGYRPGVAAQVYVWTQYLRKENKTLAEGLESILAGTKAAGYDNVELISSFFTPELAGRTLERLRAHRLGLPIVYHGGPMHEPAGADKTIAETLELADRVKPAGTRIINANPSPKPGKERKSDAELDFQARSVGRLGRELRKKGFRLILHHHDPEMAEGAREWRHLLEHTDAGLCLDTMWIARGGQNVMEIVRQAGDRLVSLHLRNLRHGVCTEAFGDGEIDYRELAAYLRQRNFRGWLVVELFHEEGTAVTRPLEENLRLSRRYAQEVFGV
jgi:inosose dehydratase